MKLLFIVFITFCFNGVLWSTEICNGYDISSMIFEETGFFSSVVEYQSSKKSGPQGHVEIFQGKNRYSKDKAPISGKDYLLPRYAKDFRFINKEGKCIFEARAKWHTKDFDIDDKGDVYAPSKMTGKLVYYVFDGCNNNSKIIAYYSDPFSLDLGRLNQPERTIDQASQFDKIKIKDSKGNKISLKDVDFGFYSGGIPIISRFKSWKTKIDITKTLAKGKKTIPAGSINISYKKRKGSARVPTMELDELAIFETNANAIHPYLYKFIVNQIFHRYRVGKNYH